MTTHASFSSGMISSQEILIFTQSKRELQISVDKHPTCFIIEGVILTGSTGTILTTQKGMNAVDTLKACLAELVDKLTKAGDVITKVDNPCNDPFVTIQQQKDILVTLGQASSVYLNGTLA